MTFSAPASLARSRARLGRFPLCSTAGALTIAGSVWLVTSSVGTQTSPLGAVLMCAAGLALVIAGEVRRRKRPRSIFGQHEPVGRGQRGHARPVEMEYQSRAVAETYDRRRFGSFGGRYNNWRLHRLLNSIVRALPPGSTVLDVPCGTGRIDRYLLRRSLRVIALDISTPMLTVARRKLRPQRSGLEFLRADANHLPLRSRSVQAVLCIRFLHLMDPSERQTVLGEMARVANRWVIVEYRNVDPFVKAVKRAILARLRGGAPRRRRTIAGIDQELHQCGLVAADYYYVSRWFSGSVLVAARRRSSPDHRGSSGAVAAPEP